MAYGGVGSASPLPLGTHTSKMDKKDIATKEFSHSLWGYNAEEVDAFLDEIIREFERHESAISLCQTQMKLLAAKLVKLRANEKKAPDAKE